MSPGQVAKVFCPSSTFTRFDRDPQNNPSQKDLDYKEVTYELELLKCDYDHIEPVQMLTYNRCMYLTLTGPGANLALTVSNIDKYAPRKTGVYNVNVERWSGPKCGNIA